MPSSTSTNVRADTPPLYSEAKGPEGRLNISTSSEDTHGYIYVDWDGPQDPANPRNWSSSRKWFISSFGFIFLTLVGVANAGYAISQPSLEKGEWLTLCTALGISSLLGTLGVAMFIVPFGIAPLVLAPCSELFGRLPVYIASAVIFWLMFLPQALAKNVETVLITRVISGVGASTSVSLVGGMLADMWDAHERGFPMAMFSSIAFAGTGLGPVTLGYVELKLGYVFINWILFAVSGVCTLGLIIASRETRASVLLIRKAKLLRMETGNDAFRAKAEEERASVAKMLKTSLLRPLRMLFTEPVLFLFAVSSLYAVYLMLEAIPLVFIQLYHFNAGEYGLVYLGQIIGPIIGMVANVWCDRAYKRNVAIKGPEARLYIAMWSGIALPIGCWVYTWTSFSSIHWIVPSLATCIIYAAVSALACFNYATDSYTAYASSALGGISAVRLIIGAVFSLLAQPMYDSLGIQFAGTILAALSTVFAITPFLLYRYGFAIRSRSKFAKELAILEAVNSR
ncbi:hypothetical protein M422DRAFT_191922 [Sphaerobolus stellatus SS14]|uniref:Major facilitator superfamily (MFS) profile domain-containing protein n=1 Tax=Sphaerobolus stellatus (strain SS14) TaxID=990650 RepID=A0A0C9TXX3_SPHS4|nr:hypothetical protein M422DRAFT_191922 [Sphaerobolus stellatus SS14]